MNAINNRLKNEILNQCNILDYEYIGIKNDVCSVSYKDHPVKIWSLAKGDVLLSILLLNENEMNMYCRGRTPFDLYLEIQERMPHFSIAIDNADHIVFSCRARSVTKVGFEMALLMEVADCIDHVKKLIER